MDPCPELYEGLRNEDALRSELELLNQQLWFVRMAFLKRTRGVFPVIPEAVAVFEEMKLKGFDDNPSPQTYHRLEGKVAALRWVFGSPQDFYDT